MEGQRGRVVGVEALHTNDGPRVRAQAIQDANSHWTHIPSQHGHMPTGAFMCAHCMQTPKVTWPRSQAPQTRPLNPTHPPTFMMRNFSRSSSVSGSGGGVVPPAAAASAAARCLASSSSSSRRVASSRSCSSLGLCRVRRRGSEGAGIN